MKNLKKLNKATKVFAQNVTNIAKTSDKASSNRHNINPYKTINKLAALTLSKVFMAKQASDKASSLRLIRASEPKAPTNKVNKLAAFTLAEVLITLAIIGVVAALTIPTVIRNYQKQQVVTQLKKVYSQLNSAIQMSIVEYGDPIGWDFCEFGQESIGRKQFYEKYFKPYLKVVKEYPLDYSLIGKYKWLNGNEIGNVGYIPSPSYYKVVLNDGTFISFEACQGSAQRQQVYFHVDLNGPDNPPNTTGKDCFYFSFAKNNKGKVLPSGYSESDEAINNNCKKSGSGELCAAKIMRDGWQMKNDYPW